MTSTQKNIEQLYSDILFKDGFANRQTGVVKETNKKFETFPFIGSNYGKLKRILVVGLDVGKEEVKDRIQTFEDRKSSIEDTFIEKLNPHISGTYFTALYFLKEELSFTEKWNEIADKGTFKKLIRTYKEELPKENPLSFIALSNYYKFVTINRENRMGDLDRVYLSQAKEKELVIKEVAILNPEIIVFQSVRFNNPEFREIINQFLKDKRRVFVGRHPSSRVRGGRMPFNFIRDLKEIK